MPFERSLVDWDMDGPIIAGVLALSFRFLDSQFLDAPDSITSGISEGFITQRVMNEHSCVPAGLQLQHRAPFLPKVGPFKQVLPTLYHPTKKRRPNCGILRIEQSTALKPAYVNLKAMQRRPLRPCVNMATRQQLRQRLESGRAQPK
jgi:hypothetical protein